MQSRLKTEACFFPLRSLSIGTIIDFSSLFLKLKHSFVVFCLCGVQRVRRFPDRYIPSLTLLGTLSLFAALGRFAFFVLSLVCNVSLSRPCVLLG